MLPSNFVLELCCAAELKVIRSSVDWLGFIPVGEIDTKRPSVETRLLPMIQDISAWVRIEIGSFGRMVMA
ncbi:MAG: hypothetical protein VXV95_00995 [Candidatus Thermoplasmatota archaeon]|nr:hypothetical protein [Candidatus Thermoplasmatota archaeon]